MGEVEELSLVLLREDVRAEMETGGLGLQGRDNPRGKIWCLTNYYSRNSHFSMRKLAGSPYMLRTLRKGLAVLEAFEDGPADLTLTEVAHRLGEPPPVVFRILKTLEEHGFVQRNHGSKRYSLGLRTWEIATRALNRIGLIDSARPVLRWLTEVTDETSSVAVVRGTDLLYVGVQEGLAPLRAYVEPGSRVPLHPTASGKAILACSGPGLFRAVVKKGLKRFTPATITSAGVLRSRLDDIRETGLSVAHGEYLTHLSAVAAPIFNPMGECVAAIAASGLSMRFEGEHLEQIKEHVRKAAEETSVKLSGGLVGSRDVPVAGQRNQRVVSR